MKHIMIFEPLMGGHVLEYLHHIYLAATEDIGNKYIFVVSPYFENVKREYSWPDSNNIHIHLLTQEEVCNCDKTAGLIKNSISRSKLVKKYVKAFNIDRVFLIFLMAYMPYLLFVLPSRIKVSGIVYRIFLHNDMQGKSKLYFMAEWVRFWLLAKLKSSNKIMILNDEYSVGTLNNTLHTTKFVFLPDPFLPVKGEIGNLREVLSMRKGQKLFVHLGALSRRKGTIEILDAISLIGEERKDEYVFYFAGCVFDDIKDEFYNKFDFLKKNGYSVRLKDEYCSYEFMASLSRSADCILIPYFNTCQSSGILGYASYYKTPVIGPSNGLLGNIIRNNKLGYTLDIITPLSIANAMLEFKPLKVTDGYAKKNDITTFTDIIIKQI